MLRSNLCDYTDAYAVVKEIITVKSTNANNQTNKLQNFENKKLFT